MATKKFTELDPVATLAGEDVLAIVDDPSGTPASKKATVSQIATDVTHTVWSVDNLRLDGNTLSSTNANGDVTLSPNGTGRVVVDTAKELRLPSHTDAATPTLNFGDGDTGFFEDGDDVLRVSVAGAQHFRFLIANGLGAFIGTAGGSAVLYNRNATATVPTVLPNANDAGTDTGIGSPGEDQLSLIAGGVEIARLSEGVSGVSNGLTALRAVEANTAGSGAPNVLAAIESRTLLTNEGATAESYHTLPNCSAGLEFIFYAVDSDGIRVTCAAGDEIEIGGSVSATGGFIRLPTNASVHLVGVNATRWMTLNSTGSITVDA